MTAGPLLTVLLVLGTVGLYVRLAVVAGIALAPGFWIARAVFRAAATQPEPWRLVAQAGGLAAGYFTYVVSVVFVVGGYRVLTRAGTPLGSYPYYSWRGFQWARYNSLISLVRHTALDFMRLTPLLPLFHRLMGMKVGARVQINTPIIFDSNLIEIGDDTVIGGDVTLIGHTAEGGRLVTGRVRIGRRVTVGVRAIVFPDTEIGDGAVIVPNAFLPPNTRVGPGEVWAGSPARRVAERRDARAVRAVPADRSRPPLPSA